METSEQVNSGDEDKVTRFLSERATLYGFNDVDPQDLPNLEVRSPMLLSRQNMGKDAHRFSRTLRIGGFEALKELFGTPYEVAKKVGMTSEHQREARRLIEIIKNKRSSEHSDGIGPLRRLAQLYLYQDDGSITEDTSALLRRWRFPIDLRVVMWNTIIVYPGETLTIAADLHVLTAYKLILHSGGRLEALGSLKIDVYSMESY